KKICGTRQRRDTDERDAGFLPIVRPPDEIMRFAARSLGAMAETTIRHGSHIYTTRLQKGGAQFSEMRRLVQEWDGRPDCAERLIRENVLSSSSRLRARDTVMRVF